MTRLEFLKIITASQRGDRQAFQVLYEEYFGKLSKTAEAVKTEKLTDVNKHIIIIFEATYDRENKQISGTDNYNNYVYEEFNYMLSKIVYDVKYLSGRLPKINLIGHSRGGITNLQYALDHPDLVYNQAHILQPFVIFYQE